MPTDSRHRPPAPRRRAARRRHQALRTLQAWEPARILPAYAVSLNLRAAGQSRHGVAVRPVDPAFHGHVILDFDAWCT